MTDDDFRGDDFERSLLASAESDAMRVERKAALAAALGIGAGAATVAASGAGAAKVATAGAAASKAKAALSLAIVKWLAAGAVGSAAVVLVTTSVVHSRDVRETEISRQERARAAAAASPTAAVAAPPTAAVVATATPSPVPPEPAPEIVAAPAEVRAVPEVVAPPPARSAPAAQVPALAAEQRPLERARAAMAAGDFAVAAQALDEHDRVYPSGAFTEESRVLRIDLLERSGDRAAARREARRFLSRTPNSPYAAHLRALASEEPTGSP